MPLEAGQPQTNGLIPVLWMDDKPKAIEYIKGFLDRERAHFSISIEISSTIDDTRSRLATGRYAALVADCQMDEFDPSENGAEFLREVHESNRTLPLFVYSGFLEHPLYVDHLRRCPIIAVAGKTDELDPPLRNHAFFRKLDQAALTYYEIRAVFPERIRFRKYRDDPQKYARSVGAHWQRHGNWIQSEAIRNAYAWVVVVGEKIHKASKSLDDYPSEGELISIGESTDLIPFAYGFVGPPEETFGVAGTAWGPMDESSRYPRLCVEVSDVRVEDDFDTGAGLTHVSDTLVPQGLLDFWHPSETGHLGRPYRYFIKRVALGVVDSYGGVIRRQVPVSVVEKWTTSGFTLFNKARRCLIGRDVLNGFDIAVVLDSRSHSSIVRNAVVDGEICPFITEGVEPGKKSCTLFSRLTA
jgi:hypothetical protein